MKADVEAILRDLRAIELPAAETVRAVRRRHALMLKHRPGPGVLAVVTALAATHRWPERLVAFELLNGHAAAMQKLTPATVERLASGLADWGSIDLFGVTVAGQAWRAGRIDDLHIRRWTRSPDRWRRRLALVATVPLNSRARGGAGDVARTLSVCRALVDDRDDMVVKALSWALRELAKRDPAAVRSFLRQHDARVAARVRREVRSKLETGLKNRRSGRL